MTHSKFVWGASTASIQIEGGADSRGLSNWDVFCETQGRVHAGHDARIAADHINHVEQDVAILREMGLKAYRFSVSWPRIMPEGLGQVSEEGIAFYDRLIDSLLSNGIEPYLTIFHWDLPYALHLKGGWLNPDISNYISDYTKILVEHFSDRVRHWITLNEPQCFINLSYRMEAHAPGYRVSDRELALAAHNALLSHGKMVQVIKSYAKLTPTITYTQAMPMSSIPYTNTENDIEAARNRQFSITSDFAGTVSVFADPIYLGAYPTEYLNRYESILPNFGHDDFKIISSPIDFLGVNIYMGDYVTAGPNGEAVVVPPQPGHAKTAYNWQVRPECMYWANRFCFERYNKPIIITENGMSGNDWVHLDGKVHDYDRIDYINRHLLELNRAMRDGVDIRGYFHWSLLDNFEWAQGYHERFGLVHVDFENGNRTMKDSAYHFAEIAKTNGNCIGADFSI